MNNIIHSKHPMPPELQASIVDPILKLCVGGITIFQFKLIKRLFPITYHTLREYIFCLIDYGVVSYNAEKQRFTIEDGGYDILFMIKEEKELWKTSLNNIVVTFEDYGKF
ncbi:MAG: hypothetical protein ACTHKC_08065 [Candidatus Nitrosocosmicus sp.]